MSLSGEEKPRLTKESELEEEVNKLEGPVHFKNAQDVSKNGFEDEKELSDASSITQIEGSSIGEEFSTLLRFHLLGQ